MDVEWCVTKARDFFGDRASITHFTAEVQGLPRLAAFGSGLRLWAHGFIERWVGNIGALLWRLDL